MPKQCWPDKKCILDDVRRHDLHDSAEVLEHAKWLDFLLTLLKIPLKKELNSTAEAAVVFLKKKGLAEVMGQFTHTGTVLYKESENQTYIPLKGKAAIQKKLDDGLLGLLLLSGCDAVTRHL